MPCRLAIRTGYDLLPKRTRCCVPLPRRLPDRDASAVRLKVPQASPLRGPVSVSARSEALTLLMLGLHRVASELQQPRAHWQRRASSPAPRLHSPRRSPAVRLSRRQGGVSIPASASGTARVAKSSAEAHSLCGRRQHLLAGRRAGDIQSAMCSSSKVWPWVWLSDTAPLSLLVTTFKSGCGLQEPTVSLQQLCSSQDVLELIAKHLPLKGFAALAATCRALRDAVALVSAATWRHSARREHVPQHPVHRAACVVEYLRTQHRVHSNIAANSCTAQELATAEGVISPDLSQHATLASSREARSPLALAQQARAVLTCSCTQGIDLVITDLATGATLHRLLLPPGAAECHPTHVLWTADCHLLAVRLGEAWGLQQDPDPPGPDYLDPEGAGLALADLRTGSCTTVELPSQQRLLEADYMPRCSAWSSTGHLLVLQASTGEAGRDGAEPPAMLVVYDARGSVVASTTAPMPGDEKHAGLITPSQLVWSPDGQLSAASLGGDMAMQFTPLCIWHPFASEQALLEVDVQADVVLELVFSPCSSLLLVQMDKSKYWLCDVYGNVVDKHAGEKQGFSPCVAWGLSGVVTTGERHHKQEAGAEFRPADTTMHWRRVQQGCLQPPFTTWESISGRPHSSPACISHDGSHCAVVIHTTQQRDGVYVETCLLQVVSSGGVSLQQSIALPEWRRLAEVEPDTEGPFCRIQWAADGTQLVCSAWDGRQHVRVTFIG